MKKLFVLFALIIPVLAACSSRDEPYEYEAEYAPDYYVYEEDEEEPPEPTLPVIFYWYVEDEEEAYTGCEEPEPIVLTVDTSPDVTRVFLRMPWGYKELYKERETENFSVFGAIFYAHEDAPNPFYAHIYAQNDYGVTSVPARILH